MFCNRMEKHCALVKTGNPLRTSQPCWKLGVTGHERLNVGQQCPLTVNKANHILGYIIYVCSLLVKLHLKHQMWFQALQVKTEFDKLERIHQKVVKIFRDLDYQPCVERLREMHLLSLAKILIAAYGYLKRNCKDDRGNLFPVDNKTKDDNHEQWLGRFGLSLPIKTANEYTGCECVFCTPTCHNHLF